MEPLDHLRITDGRPVVCPTTYDRVVRWLCTRDHTQLGSRYLVLCALILIAIIGVQIDPAATSDRVLKLTMLLVLPLMLGGFGHWLVPPMIGASRMAFPLAGAAGFWIFAVALSLSAIGFACQSEAWLITALVLAAVHAVLLAVNHVTTILVMPARIATRRRAPFFVWGVLGASGAVLLFVPVLAGAATVLGLRSTLPERSTEDAMWALLHPVAIITALPTIGMLADIVIVPNNAAGSTSVRARYGLLAIGLVCVILWAYGVLNQPSAGPAWSMTGEWVIAVGVALAVIGVAAPMRRPHDGSDPAWLWVQGALFVILTAVAAEFVLLAERVPDRFGHFQTALSVGCLFAGFGGLYHRFGQVSGRNIRGVWGRAHFAAGFVGVILILLPAHVVTIIPGLPEAVLSAGFGLIRVIGVDLILLSLLVFVVGLTDALLRRNDATVPHRAEKALRIRSTA